MALWNAVFSIDKSLNVVDAMLERKTAGRKRPLGPCKCLLHTVFMVLGSPREVSRVFQIRTIRCRTIRLELLETPCIRDRTHQEGIRVFEVLLNFSH